MRGRQRSGDLLWSSSTRCQTYSPSSKRGPKLWLQNSLSFLVYFAVKTSGRRIKSERNWRGQKILEKWQRENVLNNTPRTCKKCCVNSVSCKVQLCKHFYLLPTYSVNNYLQFSSSSQVTSSLDFYSWLLGNASFDVEISTCDSVFCNTNNHPIRVNQAENMLEMKREFQYVVTVFRLVVVVVGGRVWNCASAIFKPHYNEVAVNGESLKNRITCPRIFLSNTLCVSSLCV